MTPPQIILDRWHAGQLTGDAKHQLVVRVRPGYLVRDYIDLELLPAGDRTMHKPKISPTIFGGNNHTPWQALWTPTGPWQTLPNIQSAKRKLGFDQNGSSTLTVLMDNIMFTEEIGAAGLYHAIRRGYFSPSRGAILSSRPALWDDTGWTNALNGGYQIELWEGYGPDGDPTVIPLAAPDMTTHSCAPPDAAIDRTWTGIIEDCDLESHPDHITITARDFGVAWTDQRLQGTNKAAEILAPTTFADRRTTLGELAVVALLPPSKPTNNHTWPKGVTPIGAEASSEFDAHGGLTGWVTDIGAGFWGAEHAFSPGAGWWSAPQAAPTDWQWLEGDLVAGTYEQFAVVASFPGMQMWVSVYVGPGGGEMDGDPIVTGWVPLLGGPTAPDGTPAVNYFENVPARGETGSGKPTDLGHEFKLPEGSKLRLTFSTLPFQDPTYDTAPPFPYGMFDALVTASQLVYDLPSIRSSIAGLQAEIALIITGPLARARRELARAVSRLRELIELDSAFSLADAQGVEAVNVSSPPGWPIAVPMQWVNYFVSVPGVYAATLGDFRAQVDDVEDLLASRQADLAGQLAFLQDAIAQNAVAAQEQQWIPEIIAYYTAVWNADLVANPGYYAVVEDFRAYYLATTAEDIGQSSNDPSFHGVNAQEWVLVDDASDVIVELCVWLGFKEWDIDKFGWSLIHPMQWGSDKFFIDVVNDILAQGNFVFFMGPPTVDDRSIGVPCFKQQQAVESPPAGMVQVTDRDLLETIQVKWNLAELPFALRYRGDPVPGSDSGPAVGGQTWEEDLVATYMAVYNPPWTGTAYTPLTGTPTTRPNRVAGIARHFTQTVGVNVTIGLASDEECLFACLLSAIQYALGMCTGQLQIPGRPGMTLNQQISVIDEGDGINSRMWLASVESNHVMGSKGKWDMVLGGSYVDTEDMALVIADYKAALATVQTKRSGSTLIQAGMV